MLLWELWKEIKATLFLLLLKANFKMKMGNKLNQVWIYNADIIRV